jgi:hypothetical protein
LYKKILPLNEKFMKPLARMINGFLFALLLLGSPIASATYRIMAISVQANDNAVCILTDKGTVSCTAISYTDTRICPYIGVAGLKCVERRYFASPFSQVSNLTNITAISFRGNSICALTNSGTVKCLDVFNFTPTTPPQPNVFPNLKKTSVGTVVYCSTDEKSVFCYHNNDEYINYYGFSLIPDTDSDGLKDTFYDNCETLSNPDQFNNDGDALGNACDVADPLPLDSDGDGRGDAMETATGTDPFNPASFAALRITVSNLTGNLKLLLADASVLTLTSNGTYAPTGFLAELKGTKQTVSKPTI